MRSLPIYLASRGRPFSIRRRFFLAETPPHNAPVILLCLLLFLEIYPGRSFGTPYGAPESDIERINEIVREFRSQLQIPEEIRISIVPVNNRMVSVESAAASAGNIGAFIMRFDEHFVAGLDQDELRAAVAHELGHVWIFSHHPYLHTEALANEIAMRVVSVESLKKLYSKLWLNLGVSEDIEEFIGKDVRPSLARQ